MSPGKSSTSCCEPRRRLVLYAALGLAGCGFRPLYEDRPRGNGVPAAAELAATRVATIPDRQGQILRNAIIQRLGNGPGVAPRHELRVALTIRRELLGVRRDETASRQRVNATADFTLRPLPTGDPVFAGRAHAVDAFNIVPNEFFAAQLSGEAAEARVAERLADDIVSQIAAFYARRAVGT
ncbi:MAG: LPS assembly lipoprotein LptE [Elioraea sp.]|nr:LPS assembly lipoprotein LptE [Elioraea sp.]